MSAQMSSPAPHAGTIETASSPFPPEIIYCHNFESVETACFSLDFLPFGYMVQTFKKVYTLDDPAEFWQAGRGETEAAEKNCTEVGLAEKSKATVGAEGNLEAAN